jgi:hypothetical protein
METMIFSMFTGAHAASLRDGTEHSRDLSRIRASVGWHGGGPDG